MPVADLPFETASWGHRILALVVDWFASNLVVVAFLGPGGWSTSRGSGFYAMGVFVLESAFFMALLGGSFGQLATRLRVVRVDGSSRPLNLLMAVLRQVLICLVIPPLVFRPDGRGLHDLATGSATVPLAVLRLPRPGHG
ncbi:MAG: hypothetical protein QOH37_2039 [Nocardioidaceae bacterium]|nr:hypothetical protein [Nocardioidaceae bacterium]